MNGPPLGFRTYLFDLDGTLIDSVELILASYRHTAARHLGRVPPDEVWLRGMGTPLRRQLAELGVDETELERMVATYREHNRRYHDALLREYPGVRDVVATLRRRGARLGVVTSKMRAGAWRGLRRAGLEGLFEAVVGADDVVRPKPDAEPVLKAVELLGSEPASTVFVGDSPHDILAGRAAGVRTAAAGWGPFAREALEPYRPDYWLGAPDELLRLAP